MKRTLLETLAGMAVIVLLVSFHQQISRLKSQREGISELRVLFTKAVTHADAEKDRLHKERQSWTKLVNRVDQMETRIDNASLTTDETRRLRQDLIATKQEANHFKAAIERDFDRTRELVDAYHRESAAHDRAAEEQRSETKSNLETLASRVIPNPSQLSNELLEPTVQLNGDDTVGSGTLIRSAKNPKTKKVETFVLTSYHVVRNIFADTRSARRDGIPVTIYTKSGQAEERADMISHNEQIDAALLKLRSDKKYDSVAKVIRREDGDTVAVWDRVYAVGCPLGNDPIPSQGEISSVQNELSGSNYWMINAPTYFGNSGGGVYLSGSRELVGVFSKIYTHGRGNPVVVPHMGLCTPIDLIYDWLDGESLTYVLESNGRVIRAPAMDLASPPPGR